MTNTPLIETSDTNQIVVLDATIRNLKIKTAACKRIVKELHSVSLLRKRLRGKQPKRLT
ncbi:hypothetical protein Hdeb2414_s0008g00267221 [Helianthus debilis subsp. tardiflorus]